MADNRPGSFRSRGVSRNTIAMRKAREEDARRVAERDAAEERATGQTRVLPSSRRSAAPGEGEESARSGSSVSRRDRTVSGRTVVIHKEGDIAGSVVSTRLAGRQASSVRIAGGDTIIRYESGDMVIRRGSRRAGLRRQLIWTYALGYLALFGLYMYYLLTGVYAMAPDEFVSKAFSRRHSSSVMDLELAALEAMRGNRTSAEVRLAKTLSFYDSNKEAVRVEAGDRLTLLTAAKLGQAIIADQKKPREQRTFNEPLLLYRDTYLGNIGWPHLLMLYNSLGFFLLLGLFLWRPLMGYLGTQGKKTAVAIRNSRDAQREAADYRDRYRELAGDIEARGDKLRSEIAQTAEADRNAALEAARREAEGMAGDMAKALEDETRTLTARIGVAAALEACGRARDLLASRLGPAEHDAAVEELIADINDMKLGGR